MSVCPYQYGQDSCHRDATNRPNDGGKTLAIGTPDKEKRKNCRHCRNQDRQPDGVDPAQKQGDKDKENHHPDKNQ